MSRATTKTKIIWVKPARLSFDEIYFSLVIEKNGMLNLLLLVVLIITILIYLLVKWELSGYVKTINLIPGPKRTWIVGNVFSMPTSSSDG